MSTQVPDSESARLEVLRRYGILDTPPEREFDDLTRLASFICKAPIAFISFLDENRQWFKSKLGLDLDQTSRDISFCTYTIGQSDVFTVRDALADERFATNPLVVSAPQIRFYIGVPLIAPEGQALGTLCVADHVVRELSDEQIDSLKALACQVVTQLEFRRLAAQLQRSHAPDQREIVDTIEGIVWEADAHTLRITYVSKHAEKLLGYPVERWLLEPTFWIDHIHPDDREWVPIFYLNACKDKNAHEFEYRMVAADGRIVWLRDLITVVTENDHATRLRGLKVEITESRSAEENLARLASFVEWSPNPVIEMDSEGKVSYVNPAAYTYFADLPAVGVQHPVLEGVMTLLQGKERVLVREIKWSDRIYEQRVVPQKNRIRIYMTDLTERKEAEKALRESEVRFRGLFENIPIGVYRTTPDGRILAANPALLEMLGYSSFEELSERNLEAPGYEPQYSRQEFRERIERDGEIAGLEAAWKRWDDSVIFVRENAKVIRDAGGGVLYYEGTLEDITDRKQAEARLAERERLAAFAAEVGSVLTREDWLKTKLQQCAEAMVRDLGAGMASVWVLNKKSGDLELLGIAGIRTITAPDQPVPEYEFWIDEIAKEREPLFIDLTSVRAPREVQEWAAGIGIVFFAGYPMIVEGQLLGVMAMFSPKPLGSAAVETVGSVADEIALAIDHTWSSEALRESEDRYRDLVENTEDLICTHDFQGTILSVNRAMSRKTWYSQEEILGRKIGDFIPPKYFDQYLAYLETVQREGQATGIMTFLTRSGEEKILQYANSVRREGLAQPIVRGVLHDVTEQKRAEKALLDSEMKFRSVVQSAKEGIILADIDGKIISWNKGAQTIFGYGEEEVLGQPLTILMPERYQESHQKGMERLRLTGEARAIGKPMEVHGLRKDGKEFPLDLSLATWTTAQGTFYSGILRDITERKEIERMKNEFVSIVSHELRTPLTSIQGSLAWINDRLASQIPEQVQKLIEIAARSSERMVRMVSDMLDIDKIESGKMVFNLQPQELTPLVTHAIEANQGYAQKLGIRFVLKQGLLGVTVNVDSDRLMQVMTNLLSNAAKFSPPNEAVEVSISRNESGIRVCVMDHGPGIPEKFHPHIFQKFSQADSLGPRQKAGTGLGLNIAKAIVEKLGGRIGFETKVNEGTTFYFDLPELRTED